MTMMLVYVCGSICVFISLIMFLVIVVDVLSLMFCERARDTFVKSEVRMINY